MVPVWLMSVRSRSRQVISGATWSRASGAETTAVSYDSPGLSSRNSWPAIAHSLTIARGNMSICWDGPASMKLSRIPLARAADEGLVERNEDRVAREILEAELENQGIVATPPRLPLVDLAPEDHGPGQDLQGRHLERIDHDRLAQRDDSVRGQRLRRDEPCATAPPGDQDRPCSRRSGTDRARRGRSRARPVCPRRPRSGQWQGRW